MSLITPDLFPQKWHSSFRKRKSLPLQQLAGLVTPLTHLVKHQSIWSCMAISKLTLRSKRPVPLYYLSQQWFLTQSCGLTGGNKFSSTYKVPRYGWHQGRTTGPHTAKGLVTPVICPSCWLCPSVISTYQRESREIPCSWKAGAALEMKAA